MEATWVTIKRWMDTKHVRYIDIDIDIDIWWTTTQVIKEEGKFLLCSIMDGLGGIVLSEISQKKTNIVLYHLNVESKKYKKPKNIIKKK